jgi:hypothetical protein
VTGLKPRPALKRIVPIILAALGLVGLAAGAGCGTARSYYSDAGIHTITTAESIKISQDKNAVTSAVYEAGYKPVTVTRPVPPEHYLTLWFTRNTPEPSSRNCPPDAHTFECPKIGRFLEYDPQFGPFIYADDVIAVDMGPVTCRAATGVTSEAIKNLPGLALAHQGEKEFTLKPDENSHAKFVCTPS